MAKNTKNNKDIKKNKHFFKDFKTELKKVNWPTTKQIAKNTLAVIVVVIIAATIVAVLDLVFELFNEYGINKLKANLKNKVVVQESINNDKENKTNESNESTEEEKNQGNVENLENATIEGNNMD